MVDARRLVSTLTLFVGACAPGGNEMHAAVSEPRLVVPVDGACAAAHPIHADGTVASSGARSVGDLAGYRLPIFIERERVRVRANAIWPGGDHRNVIGTIAGRSWVLARGPLKNAGFSAGVGYALAVEDPTGRRCRGYVSATVARVR